MDMSSLSYLTYATYDMTHLPSITHYISYIIIYATYHILVTTRHLQFITCPRYYHHSNLLHYLLVAYNTILVVVIITHTITVYATVIISLTLFLLAILFTFITSPASPCTIIHHYVSSYAFTLSPHVIALYHLIIHVTDLLPGLCHIRKLVLTFTNSILYYGFTLLLISTIPFVVYQT